MTHMIEIAKISEITHDEWRHQRRLGLGGSDAATIMGANPYRDMFSNFVDKVCDELPPDIQRESAYWGTTLQPIVAAEWVKRVGSEHGLTVLEPTHTYRSTVWPFMQATIDYWVCEAKVYSFISKMKAERDRLGWQFVEMTNASQFLPDEVEAYPSWRRVVGILEVKTASNYKIKEWEAGCPNYPFAQLHHYFAVTGLRQGWAAALLGGQRFIAHDVPYDEGYAMELVEQEAMFWNEHVLKGIPPVPDPSCSDTMEAIERYERNGGTAPQPVLPLEKRVAKTRTRAGTKPSPAKTAHTIESLGPARTTGSRIPGWGTAEATIG